MSRHWKPSKKTVELQPAARPSRIRRDPVRLDEKKVQEVSEERELWGGISGVQSLFGLMLAFAIGKRRIVVLLVPVIVAAAAALWVLLDDMDATFDWGLIRCILGFAIASLK